MHTVTLDNIFFSTFKIHGPNRLIYNIILLKTISSFYNN